MHKLSFIILFILINSAAFSQSPHGDNLKFDCQDCHSTDTWKINISKLNFDHSQTGFTLEGQHKVLDCQSCHASLKFTETKSNCFDCHESVHQNTVEPNCENCHNTNSWVINNIDEMHSKSRFPLVGAHKLADCQQCHSSVNNLMFQVLGVQCIDCHISDFQTAKSPDHIAAGFSKDCEECHRVSDIEWGSASVNHDFFPLVGGHRINNCFDCHAQNTFKGLSQECITCHQKDFNSTTDPNHSASNFSTDCIECHTINPGWKPATFKNHDQFFILDGAHKQIENDCSKCHTNGYTNTPDQCYDCHKTNYESTANPSHQAAGFGTDCESCHTTNAWQPASFDHDNQFFPIYSGTHNGQWNQCSDCHTNSNDFVVFSCVTCHEHNQTTTTGQHNDVNGFIYESSACYACHPTGRAEGGFNHANTGFPLTGVHISTACTDCHTSGYQGTSPECISCHLSNYQGTTNPNHQQLGLDQNCSTCHTTDPNWQPAQFPVHNDFYVLSGAHATIANDCNSCHNGDYSNRNRVCYDCHVNDYNNTNDPNHKSTGFGTDCESCHNSNAWKPANFDHDNQFFPIYSGKHNNQWNVCSDCHTNASNYQVFECINCHEHNKTDTDSHHSNVQGYLYVSSECYACHPMGSSDGSFNHSTSSFPLTGAHVSVSCADCHQNGYANTSQECVSCHQSNYNNSAEPKHVEAGISTDCINCHNSTAWKPSIFDHSITGFALTNAHNLSQCSSCHVGNTTTASPECYSCHAANYNSAPEHISQNYPKTCQDCHKTTNWNDTNFDHNKTNFPLTGVHVNVNCSDCHTSGYVGTSMECYSCHLSNYNNAANPNHAQAGISTKCEDCHNTAAFNPSTFDHLTTGFALTNAHNLPQCSSCHSVSTSNASSDCYSCHQSNYTNAPEHVSQNYPKTCQDCHNTTNWSETNFDHNKTNFPLTGVHINVKCADCHTNGYAGTSMECYSCHQSNYTNAANPNHAQAGISTKCEDCHNTAAFNPSTFDHSTTGFALTNSHNLPQCSSCHSGSTSNASPECYTCHESNYTSAPEHVSQNYPKTCQDCHNTINWSSTNFDHSKTNFPLTGAHINVSCSDCHTSGYAGTSTQCYSCHQSNYNSTSNPPHASSGFGTTCEDCHNTSNWNDATFDHDGQFFPIYSGKHSTVWNSCATCHTNSNDYSVFSCIDCHEHSQTNVDGHHSGVQNYSYNSAACYDCHPNGRAGSANLDPSLKIESQKVW